MSPRPHPVTSTALAVGSLLLVGTPVSSAYASSDTSSDPTRTTAPGVYVVTLAAPPAASYDGGVDGLRPTRPVDGERFDRTRPAVTAYTDALIARQDRLLQRIGDPTVLYRYTTAVDGFAARLSSEQVEQLRATPGVTLVERSTRQHVDRAQASPVVGSSSRNLLGLDGPRGAWADHGGAERAGKGVVVGVVDTGIWPENPSFTGLPQTTPGIAAGLPGFHGACVPGEEWTPQTCTDKVVSARWFVSGFGEENLASADYVSARDGTGHGSHVASTAAGNHGVRVQVDGQRFGTTSGMAPAARLAVYKACWTAPDPADDGCSTADTVAAVDSAVADGVDVLNYSVSGSDRPDDSVERAFLGAATAGVFVAASAGNDGVNGSVAHVAPWVTSVAASTHHAFQGAVRLGNGRAYVGAMVSDHGVPSTDLVLGSDAAASGAAPADALRCTEGSLDAALTQGKIVVCQRGGSARVDKSATVAGAGGAGMVLANTRPEGSDADVHAVPTVHLDSADAAEVVAYVRRAGAAARASFDPAARTRVRVPAVAAFSARGPTAGSGGDVLKPDLTAPGVSVLGAVAPPSDSGRSWDLVSGTSTSAPHVAGLAAFIAGVRTDWSPARIKSAMMTTADALGGPDGPLDEGAGHVDPTDFLDPGLVFDTNPGAWLDVLAGRARPRDLNSASVAVGDLVGPTTVSRRITNVSGRRESYTVRVRGLDDVDVQAFPASVALAPGESRTIRLRITARPTATVDRDVTGWLVWSGDRHRVRVPVSVRPTVVAAPHQVDARGVDGSVVVRGRSGNGRTVKLRSTGLVPARTTPVTLTAGAFDPADPQPDADTEATPVTVPDGTDVARFETSAEAGDDVDLYVYRDDQLVDSATSGSSDAQVTLIDPAAGSYTVYVNAHDAGEDLTTDGELYTWVVPANGGSDVSLSTDAVGGAAAGERFRYSASWEGLDPSKRWLGVVAYGDTDDRTLVEVN